MDYSDLPRGVDDGLPIPSIGPWAREKYLRMWGYARVFATSMKNKWRRVYVDMFSGPGYGRVEGMNDILYGSPLLALTIPDRFDRYIFCDEDPLYIDALKARTRHLVPNADPVFVPGNVNETIASIIDAIPLGTKTDKVLTFAFADPYNLGIRFETVRALATARYTDFLILLAVGMDANRNLKTYIKANHKRVEEFLGDPDWRVGWKVAERRGEGFPEFLANQFSEAMLRLGYQRTPLDKMFLVRSDDKNLPLYRLAFFSRHELGTGFWDQVLKYADPQLGLGL